MAGGGELPEGGRGFDRDICLFKRQLDVYKLVFLKVLKKTICNYMVFKHIYEYSCQHVPGVMLGGYPCGSKSQIINV